MNDGEDDNNCRKIRSRMNKRKLIVKNNFSDKDSSPSVSGCTFRFNRRYRVTRMKKYSRRLFKSYKIFARVLLKGFCKNLSNKLIGRILKLLKNKIVVKYLNEKMENAKKVSKSRVDDDKLLNSMNNNFIEDNVLFKDGNKIFESFENSDFAIRNENSSFSNYYNDDYNIINRNLVEQTLGTNEPSLNDISPDIFSEKFEDLYEFRDSDNQLADGRDAGLISAVPSRENRCLVSLSTNDELVIEAKESRKDEEEPSIVQSQKRLIEKREKSNRRKKEAKEEFGDREIGCSEKIGEKCSSGNLSESSRDEKGKKIVVRGDNSDEKYSIVHKNITNHHSNESTLTGKKKKQKKEEMLKNVEKYSEYKKMKNVKNNDEIRDERIEKGFNELFFIDETKKIEKNSSRLKVEYAEVVKGVNQRNKKKKLKKLIQFSSARYNRLEYCEEKGAINDPVYGDNKTRGIRSKSIVFSPYSIPVSINLTKISKSLRGKLRSRKLIQTKITSYFPPRNKMLEITNDPSIVCQKLTSDKISNINIKSITDIKKNVATMKKNENNISGSKTTIHRRSLPVIESDILLKNKIKLLNIEMNKASNNYDILNKNFNIVTRDDKLVTKICDNYEIIEDSNPLSETTIVPPSYSIFSDEQDAGKPIIDISVDTLDSQQKKDLLTPWETLDILEKVNRWHEDTFEP